jgi:hypothetical protein
MFKNILNLLLRKGILILPFILKASGAKAKIFLNAACSNMKGLPKAGEVSDSTQMLSNRC